MAEWFNRTLKSVLSKYVATDGYQWDQYLSGVLFAYRNIPHELTGEKPSYLHIGLNCRKPLESAYLQLSPVQVTDIQEYHQESTMLLATARDIATEAIIAAQKKVKSTVWQQERTSWLPCGRLGTSQIPSWGDWRRRKLFSPWHDPYRVTTL